MDENETTQGQGAKTRKLPSYFYNTTSMIGLGLAGVTLCLMAFLYFLELFSIHENPYVGLITFVALPPFLILGLLFYFIGAMRAHRRAKKGITDRPLPQIDFNKKAHRVAFSIFAACGVLFGAASAFGSYQAYEYTDSVDFCGKVCHAIMKPEYTAYLNSPHARVKCTQCHIGEGATWYVKSKLSGAYQVYSTIFHKYNKPIPTPIKNLRPARETCEQCHWPSHYYPQKLKDRTYFAADDGNTRFEMSMLMKIGGAQHGATEGIHAHMYIDNEITYIATDSHRQVIPYVESKGKDGKITIYRSTEDQITDDQIKNGVRRVVDCIDCHNRPSHRYPHPAKSVNLALSKGWIDPSLPSIKSLAIEALEKPYKTEEEAVRGIADHITSAYQKDHAQAAKDKVVQLQAAIAQIQQIYKTSYFPEMGANWTAFPDNLDHMYGKGCFRCHDDKHVSADGKKITRDCNTCHTILSIRPAGEKEVVDRAGLPFRHPTDIGDAWKETMCKDCHVSSP